MRAVQLYYKIGIPRIEYKHVSPARTPATAAVVQKFVYPLLVTKLTVGIRILSATAVAFAVCMLWPNSTPNDLQRPIFGPVVTLGPPVSMENDILLVESTETFGPVTAGAVRWAEILLALIELNAEKTIEVSPSTKLALTNGGAEDRLRDIEARFDEEFALVENNITTLFEAIRLGSVRAVEAGEYIEALRKLVKDSRKRLLDDVSGDDAGPAMLAQVRAAFDNGTYGNRHTSVGFTVPRYNDAIAMILPPAPVDGALPFRRLDAAELDRYVQRKNDLYALLVDMQRAGYFALIEPESYPTFVWDHARSNRTNVLEEPGKLTRHIWRDAIDNAIAATEEYLFGDAQERLLAGYDSLVSEHDLEKLETRQIDESKRAVGESFASTQEIFKAYNSLRTELMRAIDDAIVIVGSGPDPDRAIEEIWRAPSRSEEVAVIVNGVRTDTLVVAPTGWRRALRILAVIITIAIAIAFMRPVISLITGAALFVIVVVASVSLFVFFGIWFDPLLLVATTAACIVTSTLVASLYRRRIIIDLTGRIKSRFPARMLKRIMSRGALPTEKVTTARAVVLAVQYIGEAAGTPIIGNDEQSVTLRQFQATTARAIRRNGGVILSADGFLIVAGFDVPLDRHRKRKRANNLEMTISDRTTCSNILEYLEVAKQTEDSTYYGLDVGECRFVTSSITGYGATGNSIVYAKRLSGLVKKYDNRIAVTRDIADLIRDTWVLRKLGSVVGTTVTKARAFYAVTGRRQRDDESEFRAPST